MGQGSDQEGMKKDRIHKLWPRMETECSLDDFKKHYNCLKSTQDKVAYQSRSVSIQERGRHPVPTLSFLPPTQALSALDGRDSYQTPKE